MKASVPRVQDVHNLDTFINGGLREPEGITWSLLISGLILEKGIIKLINPHLMWLRINHVIRMGFVEVYNHTVLWFTLSSLKYDFKTTLDLSELNLWGFIYFRIQKQINEFKTLYEAIWGVKMDV